MQQIRKRKPTARQGMIAAKPARNRRSAEQMLVELKRRLREASDLTAAGDVLNWDQATYMPRGGADARGRQCAVIFRLAHEQAVSPALGKLLDALARYGESLPHNSDDASLIRVARRDFQKMIKIPTDHVASANAHLSASYNAWTRARPADDFAAMVPYLERTLDLSREYSSYFASYKHVADPLIDDADEGTTTVSIRKLFSELKSQLVPMVCAICEQPVGDDSCSQKPRLRPTTFSQSRDWLSWTPVETPFPSGVPSSATLTPCSYTPAEQVGQLGNPGLVAGEQMRRRSPPRLLLEIGVGERLPLGVADDEAFRLRVDRPRRREGACGRDAALGRCGKNATHPGKPRCPGCRSAISPDIFRGMGTGYERR
jgi:Carboxypeptidase Taq (M32) metallopeptidase